MSMYLRRSKHPALWNQNQLNKLRWWWTRKISTYFNLASKVELERHFDSQIEQRGFHFLPNFHKKNWNPKLQTHRRRTDFFRETAISVDVIAHTADIAPCVASSGWSKRQNRRLLLLEGPAKASTNSRGAEAQCLFNSICYLFWSNMACKAALHVVGAGEDIEINSAIFISFQLFIKKTNGTPKFKQTHRERTDFHQRRRNWPDSSIWSRCTIGDCMRTKSDIAPPSAQSPPETSALKLEACRNCALNAEQRRPFSELRNKFIDGEHIENGRKGVAGAPKRRK